jgi:hypothetical protein
MGVTACFLVNTTVLDGGIERSSLYGAFRAMYFDSTESFVAAFEVAVGQSEYAARVRLALLRFSDGGATDRAAVAIRRFRFIRDHALQSEQFHSVMSRLLSDHGVDERSLSQALWMTGDHVRSLHRTGHVIGMHSHSRPLRLSRLSPQLQRDEYTTNFRRVRQITGAAPAVMSHPDNSYSPYTLSVLRQLGVRVGFRADAAPGGGCALEYPRVDPHTLLRDLAASDEAMPLPVAA